MPERNTPGFSQDIDQLKAALSAAGIGVWEVDTVNNMVYWDDRCCELIGLERQHAIPFDQSYQYIYPDDLPYVNRLLDAALKGENGGAYDATYRTIGADNQVRWVHFTGSAYMDEEGRVLRFGGVARDVSIRHQAQQQASESEQFIEFLSNSVPAMIFYLDDRQCYKSYNNTFRQWYNVGETEAIGVHVRDFIGEVAYARIYPRLVRAYAGEQVSFEMPAPGRLDKDRWLSIVYTPDVHEDGHVAGIIIHATDATNSKRTEIALRESEAKFRSIFEQAPMGIALAEGRDMLVTLGNDRIFEIWGKSPDMTGLPIMEILPELEGQPFMQLMHDVYDTGIPYIGAGTLAQLKRKGVLEDAYFDFVYTPIRSDDGRITGVMTLATEVTNREIANQAIAHSEARFRSLIEQAPVATCLFTGRELKIEVANDQMIRVWGKDSSAIGKSLSEAVPELVGQPFLDILDQVYTTGVAYSATAAPADLIVDGVLSRYYFNFTYKPLFDENEQVYGIIDMAVDVTKQVLATQATEESEARFRSLIEEAPIATCLFIGREMRIEIANETFLDFVGKDTSVIGKSLIEAMPELNDQHFLTILDEVYTTGETYSATGAPAVIEVDGKLETHYFDFTYKPLRDEHGRVYGILEVSANVTPQVLALQDLEEKEIILNNAVELAELGNWTVYLPEGRTTLAPRMAEWFDVEMTEADLSVFMQSIQDEYRSRVRNALFHTLDNESDGWFREEYTVVSLRTGQRRIISAIGRSFFDKYGKPFKIEGTARDVTSERLHQYELEQKEAALRSAIELAELGTWTVDLITGKVIYSERLKSWLGDNHAATGMGALSHVHPDDMRRISDALSVAIEGNGRFDEIYKLANLLSDSVRVVHSSARVHFDGNGNALRIEGTAQDITVQQDLQAALEAQVRVRTDELQLANLELAGTNELLTRSNEELAQYAYVASHDLQEPLRKIQVFTDMLSSDSLSSESGKELLNKIFSSAERMRMLIINLLDFSQLTQSDSPFHLIDLNQIVKEVLRDFELMAEEKGATFKLDKLPSLEAVSLQMNQLFYNLISNSLKFTKPDESPVIRISCDICPPDILKKYVKVMHPSATYYRIHVQDNGIGFDQQHADQIFEIFKRLHGRNSYPGFGIGLALCRKIVSNHGGVLLSDSTPGDGASFWLVLPDRQP
jgi:PAS domain S-box-containing protein